jgi:hypothetical protein
MDVFQLIGDFLHLLAVIMLVLKILANKNVIGIILILLKAYHIKRNSCS